MKKGADNAIFLLERKTRLRAACTFLAKDGGTGVLRLCVTGIP